MVLLGKFVLLLRKPVVPVGKSGPLLGKFGALVEKALVLVGKLDVLRAKFGAVLGQSGALPNLEVPIERSEVLGFQACVLGETGEHARADLLAVVKCKDDRRPAGTLEDSV